MIQISWEATRDTSAGCAVENTSKHPASMRSLYWTGAGQKYVIHRLRPHRDVLHPDWNRSLVGGVAGGGLRGALRRYARHPRRCRLQRLDQEVGERVREVHLLRDADEHQASTVLVYALSSLIDGEEGCPFATPM